MQAANSRRGNSPWVPWREKTMNEDWKTKLKATLGFIVKGAKWYVKARYGVDVDQILKERTKDV